MPTDEIRSAGNIASIVQQLGRFIGPRYLIECWNHLNKDDLVFVFFKCLHLPGSISPIATPNLQVEAIDQFLHKDAELFPHDVPMDKWKRSQRSQRSLATFSASPILVKALKGDMQHRRLKDLQSRVATLQDEIYEQLISISTDCGKKY